MKDSLFVATTAILLGQLWRCAAFLPVDLLANGVRLHFTPSLEPKLPFSFCMSSENSDDLNTQQQTSQPDLIVLPLAVELKESLVTKISEFRDLKEQDGDVVIDFGVKGGELNQTSRAPQKIDFYSISKEVGDKATEVIEICEKLSNYTPIPDPTRFVGDKNHGKEAPLNGPWKSLFTTAADANFSSKSKRGAAKVQNIVNGEKGTIANVIDFTPKDDGTDPVFKQLNVVIKAIAVSPKRIELQFKYAKVVLTKFLWFKFRWALYIPVPGPFITRCIVFLSRIVKFGKKGSKSVPKGYFDVLYLDNDLRVHRTGEDNIFVQARGTWDLAKPLLE